MHKILLIMDVPKKSVGLVFELFLRGEMLLAELIKVWVVFGKNTWDILKREKKKEEYL